MEEGRGPCDTFNLTVKLAIIFLVVDIHFSVINVLEALSCLLVARPLALKLQLDITLKAFWPYINFNCNIIASKILLSYSNYT